MQEKSAINKTIVVTYDDVTRMMDYCCENNEVSKEFLDWYLNEDSFFSKTGMLLIEGMHKDDANNRFAISFNFNNANLPEFSLYDYYTQKSYCTFRFSRMGNMTMKKIAVNVIKFDEQTYLLQKTLLVTQAHVDQLRKSRNNKKFLIKQSRKVLNKKISKLKKIEKESYFVANKLFAMKAVYYVYATMYYFSKNRVKEIVGEQKDVLIKNPNADGKQITSIYKYYGYVNLSETKVYRPVIKKLKNEPVREYGRHIERWSVRGHYRNVNGKQIWIAEHERGEGALEKRVYGTEKLSEVNVLPKVFEVTRTVYDDSQKEPRAIIKNETKEIMENVIEKTIAKPISATSKILQKITGAWEVCVRKMARLLRF